LDEPGTWDFQVSTITTNVGAAGKLVYDDTRLALLLPFQIAFGFASSFVPYYVFGTVIDDYLGSTWVGLLSAVIVATGALIAIPSAWIANKYGKELIMSIGGGCMALSGLAFFIFSDSSLGTWKLIVIYLMIYGMGRGTWENTNKAVIADFFTDTPELSTAAFAAVSFSNGLAGAIGYFSFGEMNRLEMAGLVLVTSIIAIICYLIASSIHEANKAEQLQNLGKYSTI
jgi:MFS family permease